MLLLVERNKEDDLEQSNMDDQNIAAILEKESI